MTGAAAASERIRTRPGEWEAGSSDILVGKDILELLSSSMYVDPLTIYREYVQNAADAIDEARLRGLLGVGEAGRVDLDLDPAARSVRIRDNGTGLKWSAFEGRLTAFGASPKRGSRARGFRGVGRLSGLGYCQELVFRSRVEGESHVSELRWDCRRLRSALRSSENSASLAEVVRDIVSVRQIDGADWPARFFEVQLNGVVRHRNDRLLSAPVVEEYLSQVAPVPFSPDFRFGAEIAAAVRHLVELGNLDIRVSGAKAPVLRPHRDRFEIGKDDWDTFTGIEFREIPGIDGGVAAIAWVLHHGYAGALPVTTRVKGLRLRSGNVQVGEHTLLEELFSEPRFNAWSVGEIHVVDRRIVPNGRRDHYEQSVHFDNLLNHLSPAARDITRRCRTSSVRRKWLREFELHAEHAREKLAILAQGTLAKAERSDLARDVERLLTAMEKIVGMETLVLEPNNVFRTTLDTIRSELTQLMGYIPGASPLSRLPTEKRAMYEHLFGLIYACSTNRSAAKALIDRILQKVV